MKACPICGDESSSALTSFGVRVGCGKCHMSVFGQDKEAAIAKWNTFVEGFYTRNKALCWNCGAPINEGAHYCCSCGAKVDMEVG